MKKSSNNILQLWKNKSGATFIEFGILASIFMTLTIAIVDFGLMMWLNNTVEHVAAEGARYASVHGSNKSSPVTAAQIVTYIEDRADGIQPEDMIVSVTWPGSTDSPPVVNPPAGSAVSILVTYNYTYLIGGMLGFEPVDLQGRSTMIVN